MAAPPTPPAVEAPSPPLPSEYPLLLAFALAPLAAGQLPASLQEPLAAQGLLYSLLLACLVWISLLLRVALPGAPPLAPARMWPLLLAFPAWAAVTVLPSANRGATILQILLYATYAAAAWLAGDLARRGGAYRIIGAFLAGGLVAGGLGLREYLEALKQGNPSWRAFGGFTNPNFFAGFLVPALLLAFTLALRQPEQFKGWTWMLALTLLTGALGGALLVTGSRGALLALGAGLLVFLFWVLLRRDLREPGTFVRLGAMGLVLVAAFFLLSGSLRARQPMPSGGTAPAASVLPAELCPDAQTTAAGDSNEFRILTWRGTLKMAQARPLLGWGAGSYETAFAPHAIADYTRHAHNSYLQLFAEEGAPGVLLWLALLLAALLALLRTPRGPEWGWVPGVGAALVATAAHNVVDSIVYIPAVAFLTWALLGMALRPRQETENSPARSGADDRKPILIAAACLGLLLVGLQTLGRGFLMAGRATLAQDASAALDTLGAAQTLLPGEPLVAIALADAYSVVGPPDKAIEAARQATRLAPERPPGYHRLAMLYRFQRDPHKALNTLTIGLERAPNEVELLYTRAQIYGELGSPEEALAGYRRIAEIEKSPVAQVRALGEMRDYRYGRARLELARAAEASGRRDEAFTHLKAAACLLAERRVLQDNNPAVYMSVGERDLSMQRELRNEEAQVWERLAKEYGIRGENRLADLAAEQAAAARSSRERMERFFEEYQRPE